MKEFYFSFLNANGITHRLCSTVPNLVNNGAGGAAAARAKQYQLVLFLHGFPESWYSWRHQLEYLRNKPFLAVAPDMRGYGSTSQPWDVEEYTLPIIAKDVIEIANALLGYNKNDNNDNDNNNNNKFIIVGHDWGAMLAWTVALLYPERILGVCAMSVPYAGTPKVGLLTMLQYQYGACLDPKLPRQVKESARFHYILHQCLPYADEEYNNNCREFLYRIYSYRKGSCCCCDIQDGTPEYNPRGLMFPPTGNLELDQTRILDARAAPGLWKRTPRPKQLPHWLQQNDLEYYINEFERSGFHGGLCWYRALDRNFELIKQHLYEKRLDDDKILPPALFLTGEEDNVTQMYGGKQATITRLKASVPNLLTEPIFVKDCGHWIQQEHPALVNNYLLDFLNAVIDKSDNKPKIQSKL